MMIKEKKNHEKRDAEIFPALHVAGELLAKKISIVNWRSLSHSGRRRMLRVRREKSPGAALTKIAERRRST